jgi:hypothetical protein
MTDLIEKTKRMLNPKANPISKDEAKMLSIVGKVVSTEQRLNDFLSEINEVIVAKARTSQRMYLVEVPEDLVEQTENIEANLIERGFHIHELSPKVVGVFVINWKI